MLFRNIIKHELEDFFTLNESDSDTVTATHMDFSNNIDEDKIDSFKKSLIRELRLSKILDGDDVDEKVEFINKIKDPNIWESVRRKEMGFDDIEEDLATIPSISTTVYNTIISLDEKFTVVETNPDDYDGKAKLYTSVYNEINNRIEEFLIGEYRKLSLINRVKLEQFHNIPPIIVDSSEDKRILAKISLAANNLIIRFNRKERGNLLIMNPITYSKMKSHLSMLKINVFQSKFMKQNEIIVTLKSDNEGFCRFVYNFRKFNVFNDDFKEKQVFELKYGFGVTSNSSESNCVLITLE